MDSHCRQNRHTKSNPFNQFHLKHHSHRQNVKKTMPILGVFVFPFWGHVKKYRLRWNFSFVVKRYLPSKGDMKIRSRSLSLGLSVWTINNRHFNIHSHLIQWDLFFSYLRCCLLSVRAMRQEGRRKTIPPHKPHSFHLSFILSIHALLLFSISHADFFQEESPKHFKKLATSDSDDHINNTHSFPSLT